MRDAKPIVRRGIWMSILSFPATLLLIAGCPTAPPTGGGDGGDGGGNGGTAAEKGYVGSDRCGDCHESKLESFRLTGHPFKLNRVENGVPPEYPVTEFMGPPEGIDLADVSFVIGGFRYKYRVIDSDGFIVLGPSAQYNFPSRGFSAYDNDESHTAPDGTVGPWATNIGRKPYNCGKCHTTGYDADAENHLGLPGLVGDWAFEGIQCEECHGPGADHVEAMTAGNIEMGREEIVGEPDSETSCGKCHTRSPDGIAASGGFVKHHEQWDEFSRSAHAAVMPEGCMTCHDPHEPLFDSARLAGIQALYDADGNDSTLDTMASPPGIIKECTDCHTDETVTHEGPTTCKTCHMAFTTKTAVATGPHSGDIRSHAWLINTDPDAPAFTDADGNPVARDDPNVTFSALNDEGEPYITLEFACLRCHQDQDAQWAADNAESIHGGS